MHVPIPRPIVRFSTALALPAVLACACAGGDGSPVRAPHAVTVDQDVRLPAKRSLPDEKPGDVFAYEAEGTLLTIALDLPKVLRSAVVEELLLRQKLRDPRWEAMDYLPALCGFDVLGALETAVVSATPDGMAMAIRTNVDSARFVACLRRVPGIRTQAVLGYPGLSLSGYGLLVGVGKTLLVGQSPGAIGRLLEGRCRYWCSERPVPAEALSLRGELPDIMSSLRVGVTLSHSALKLVASGIFLDQGHADVRAIESLRRDLRLGHLAGANGREGSRADPGTWIRYEASGRERTLTLEVSGSGSEQVDAMAHAERAREAGAILARDLEQAEWAADDMATRVLQAARGVSPPRLFSAPPVPRKEAKGTLVRVGLEDFRDPSWKRLGFYWSAPTRFAYSVEAAPNGRSAIVRVVGQLYPGAPESRFERELRVSTEGVPEIVRRTNHGGIP